jgi:hypothetical protein
MGNIISLSTSTNDIFIASLVLVAYIWLTRYFRAFDKAYEESTQGQPGAVASDQANTGEATDPKTD